MRKGLSNSEAGKLGAEAAAITFAAKKKEKITNYNISPKYCKNCNQVLPFKKRINDFCNHKCSSFFNSQSKMILSKCLYCENILNKKGQSKYCSRNCMFSFHWNETKARLLSDGYDNSNANQIAKKYLIELQSGNCQICWQNTWCGKQMPLVLDHINGNSYDNSLNNLRVICHNCDAQTSTFTGKNKGNGRIARAKRYIVEKQILKEVESIKSKLSLDSDNKLSE